MVQITFLIVFINGAGSTREFVVECLSDILFCLVLIGSQTVEDTAKARSWARSGSGFSVITSKLATDSKKRFAACVYAVGRRG